MLLCGNKEYSISFTVASHYTYKKWLVSLPTSVASIEYLTPKNPTIIKSINFFKTFIYWACQKLSFCLRKIAFTDPHISFYGCWLVNTATATSSCLIYVLSLKRRLNGSLKTILCCSGLLQVHHHAALTIMCRSGFHSK